MELDKIAYGEALDHFLLEMEGVYSVEDPKIAVALAPICDLLRIAKIDVMHYETKQDMIDGKVQMDVFIEQGEVDEGREQTIRESSPNGAVSIYRAYQCLGENDWDYEELGKIQILLKTLFAFYGRARVMKLAAELTYKDQEMGTYNLTYCMHMLAEKMSKGLIGDYGICHFDIKDMKGLNDRIGRDKANVTMRRFVHQLSTLLMDDEVVCRVEEDDFVILFQQKNLHAIMRYLTGAGIVYDDISRAKILVSTNAGYYMIPASITNPDEVMENVTIALRKATEDDSISFVFFDEELRKDKEKVDSFGSIFPSAMEKEEFKVYYQPKVHLNDYRLAGAEALCRWIRDGKMISPGEFIPVLEQTKAICSLDFYMLEHVCRDLRRWINQGLDVVKVSVNLSRRHLGDPDLVDNILEIIDRYDVPHQYIEIELTETTTDVDFTFLKNTVTGLREKGIHTSVDDFGIGYSSLNLIRQAPWSVLKIDKSFLPEGMNPDDSQLVMLRHLISMFQEMGLECIVEGVETVEQIKMLKENNCFLAQGFYFDKPLPVEEFEKRLETLKKGQVK